MPAAPCERWNALPQRVGLRKAPSKLVGATSSTFKLSGPSDDGPPAVHFRVDLPRPLRLTGEVASSLTLQPIGFLRTRQQVKFQAGHQPVAAIEERNELELLPGFDYEQALHDLDGFDRVWLLSWFHRNTAWRPMVLPPRGPAHRRGVFATRSPHRPNPLGLTAVPLLGIEGRTLQLGPCDLVDGTPILDLKPYIPAFYAFPAANAGWIDEMEARLKEPPAYTIEYGALAQEQVRWLRDHGPIDFTPRLAELLSRDPSPHRTRRIRRRGEGTFTIGCGAWRAMFTVSGHVVTVLSLEAGYPQRFLLRPGYEQVPDREVQLAFIAQWGEPPVGD